MRWLNGVSGAGVEGLGADVAYVHPARSPCAWRHGQTGPSHAQRARLRRGTAGARTHAEANKQTNKQANKQASKQASKQKKANKETNTNTNDQPNQTLKTKQAGADERKHGIAFEPWLLRITHCYRWSLARPAWHGMAWHGMAWHGMAWRRPSCDTRGEERTPRSTRRMSERACARMPGRLRVGTLRAFGLCLLLFGICWVC